MKVGILTLVLHSNFGYLMQAYALQQVIKKLGHDPYTYQLWETNPSIKEKLITFLKGFVLKYVLHQYKGSIFKRYDTKEEKDIIDQHTQRFIKENLSLSPYLKNIQQINKLNDEYESCIVGSDQVWRRWYAPRIQSYFFDFLPKSVKRTSYAASFGLSQVQYSKGQKEECGDALKKFSGISVREKEGVDVCRKEWGEKAVCVIDPTLLLKKEEYLKLINSKEIIAIPNKPYLLCYVLDETLEKMQFINKIALENGLVVFKIKPDIYNGKNDINKCIYPAISMWLESFNKASFVVTDSFHGTAFSIIFEKQFIAIGNKKRGLSRFTTLLGELNLKNRLITNIESENSTKKLIDYTQVNKLLDSKIAEGVSYLNKFLNEDN